MMEELTGLQEMYLRLDKIGRSAASAVNCSDLGLTSAELRQLETYFGDNRKIYQKKYKDIRYFEYRLKQTRDFVTRRFSELMKKPPEAVLTRQASA